MTDKRMELKNSIIRLETWERLADLADEAWDQDLLNEDCEKASDHYHELRWNEWLYTSHLIYILSDGKLTEKEARQIARDKAARERLAEII